MKFVAHERFQYVLLKKFGKKNKNKKVLQIIWRVFFIFPLLLTPKQNLDNLTFYYFQYIVSEGGDKNFSKIETSGMFYRIFNLFVGCVNVMLNC